MSTEPWVVTCGIHNSCVSELHEFYRGSREECERIKRALCRGSNDRRPDREQSEWKVIAGKASDWEEFLRDMSS